jgi:hypothetical protein
MNDSDPLVAVLLRDWFKDDVYQPAAESLARIIRTAVPSSPAPALDVERLARAIAFVTPDVQWSDGTIGRNPRPSFEWRASEREDDWACGSEGAYAAAVAAAYAKAEPKS